MLENLERTALDCVVSRSSMLALSVGVMKSIRLSVGTSNSSIVFEQARKALTTSEPLESFSAFVVIPSVLQIFAIRAASVSGTTLVRINSPESFANGVSRASSLSSLSILKS